MALISCHECGGTVSTEAAACPRCGAPVRTAREGSLAEVYRHLEAGSLIQAIAAYRQVTGAGLVDAKAAVEQIQREHTGSRGSGVAQGGCASMGCFGFFMLVLLGMCMDSDSPSSSPSAVTPSPYSVPYSAPVLEWFYIHGPLNVRAQPDKNAEVVRTLQRGDYVQLGPRDANGWALLYSTGSAEGYVYRASELVQSQAPAARSTEATRRSLSSSGGGGSRRYSGGRVLHRGPRGGCYYYTGSGNKRYVDRSYCN